MATARSFATMLNERPLKKKKKKKSMFDDAPMKKGKKAYG